MKHRVIFTPEARNDLIQLGGFIAERSSSDRAVRYIKRLRKFCLAFQTFPQRGTRMDSLRPGLRIVGFEKRVTIAFELDKEDIVILRILYGGRDLAILAAPKE